jgi:hypothetical protein
VEDFAAIFDDLSNIDVEELEEALELEEAELGDYDDGDGEELTPEQVAAYLASKEEQRCVPVPYKMKPTKKIIAVVDCETDPFAPGFVVQPFASALIPATDTLIFGAMIASQNSLTIWRH